MLSTLSICAFTAVTLLGDPPPSGGTAEPVFQGLAGPVGLEFAQDGRMWISFAGPPVAPGAGGLGHFYPFQSNPAIDLVIENYPTACNPSTGECAGAWHISLLENPDFPQMNSVILTAGGPPIPELSRIKVYSMDPCLLENQNNFGPSAGADVGGVMSDEETINVFSVLPNAVDTNLYSSVFVLEQDSFFIVDAGANAILKYSLKDDPQLSVFAELPNVAENVESVPTRIIHIPNDGADDSIAFIVTELTGGPFTEGSSTMWGFSNDGTRTALATGLTTVVDCEYEPDTHSVLFCSAGSFDFKGGIFAPGTGSIGRVNLADGSAVTLLDDLWMPAGIERFGDEIYFSTFYAGGVFKFDPADCGVPGDLNGDCCVDGKDLATLLAAWTDCP